MALGQSQGWLISLSRHTIGSDDVQAECSSSGPILEQPFIHIVACIVLLLIFFSSGYRKYSYILDWLRLARVLNSSLQSDRVYAMSEHHHHDHSEMHSTGRGGRSSTEYQL